ncbi:MAG: DUF2141 domain-containing protein [Pseudomonadota bacterium]
MRPEVGFTAGVTTGIAAATLALALTVGWGSASAADRPHGLLNTIAQPAPGELRVILEGLRSDAGRTICRIYPEGANFPRQGSVERVDAAIANGRSACVFSGVAPGRYAVAIAHDEDGDGAVDRGLLGVPTEGFAFSQNARVRLGPPDFDEAAIDVPAAGAAIRIQMTYL